MSSMGDYAPKINARERAMKKKPKINVMRVVLLSMTFSLVFLLAVVIGVYKSNDHTRPDASVLLDMKLFALFYEQYGAPLSEDGLPILIPAADAVSVMASHSVIGSDSVDAHFDDWNGSNIYVFGQKSRVLIAHVNQATCEGVLNELGLLMAEEESPLKGLERVVKSSQETPLGCHRQRWEGGVSNLYAALELDEEPDSVATYVLYLALPDVILTGINSPNHI
jgi:hypothetical protein